MNRHSQTDSPYRRGRWDLRTILDSPKGESFDELTTLLEDKVNALEAMRVNLHDDVSAKDFKHALHLSEEIADAAHRLESYAILWFSEDTGNPESLAFKGEIERLVTDAQNRVLFFNLWWKSVDEQVADRLMPCVSDDMLYYLKRQRDFKPYMLPEREEQLINIKDINGVNALTTVYAMLTNAYRFRLTVEGEDKELTRDALMSYVRKSDPGIRKAAYQALYKIYAKDGLVLAQIYSSRVVDWYEEQVKLRGFVAPISVRNLGNDIPDHVSDVLLEVCRNNIGVFQRWFRSKARLLRMDKLRRYDIYAPLSSSEKKYSYDEAVRMVLETFEKFSPTVSSAAQRVFDEGHIDSEVRPGKRSGAFCLSAIPGMTPYVLQNYTCDVRDIATLAHELGHAIHSMLAEEHSIFTFHSTLPLAETASTFSEMLLTDRLLNQETDPGVRRDLIANALDDAYATIMRQAYFTMFERKAHEVIQNGGRTDEVSDVYMESLREQFGDSVVVSEEFQWEWVSIPHFFYSPFYCYAYSFGQLLVLSLYQRYKEEGPNFITQYLRILGYGGSDSPERILNEAGVDISSPDFWQGGMDVVNGLIDDLEEITID